MNETLFNHLLQLLESNFNESDEINTGENKYRRYIMGDEDRRSLTEEEMVRLLGECAHLLANTTVPINARKLVIATFQIGGTITHDDAS